MFDLLWYLLGFCHNHIYSIVGSTLKENIAFKSLENLLTGIPYFYQQELYKSKLALTRLFTQDIVQKINIVSRKQSQLDTGYCGQYRQSLVEMSDGIIFFL